MDDWEMDDWELEDAMARQQGEIYAEFVMSWVNGGGSAYDADIAWASGIAHNNGWSMAPEGADEDGRP